MNGSNGTSPILVLAIGNRLLSDDGVGLDILELLQNDYKWDSRIEFVDGGTQGLALLNRLEDRRSVIFLDAVALRADPGTIHLLYGDEITGDSDTSPKTAHGSGAAELLAAAQLLGDLPDRIHVIGVEPEKLETSIGLSDSVQASLPNAVRLSADRIAGELNKLEHSFLSESLN
jgi:hydrogenase maturation protease